MRFNEKVSGCGCVEAAIGSLLAAAQLGGGRERWKKVAQSEEESRLRNQPWQPPPQLHSPSECHQIHNRDNETISQSSS